jgi:serine protease
MKRGEIKFIEKLKNAVNAGAGAVLFYNNEPGLVVGDLKGSVTVPVALIEQTEGEKIKEQLLRGENLKSSISNSVADFVSNSGTSMATPHITGVVALLRSKNKSLTPPQIREILSRSALKLGDGPQNFFGAGLVDAEKALFNVETP